MRNKNFHFLVKALRKEVFLDLMGQCSNFENNALLIEAYQSLQDSQASIPMQVLQMIDAKLIYLRDHDSINEKLFVDFYDSYMNSKNAQNESFPKVIETYQRKIYKTFSYVFQPYYENFKAKELLFEPLMIWMVLMTHRQNSLDYKCVIEIAKVIRSSLVKKNFFSFSSDLDQDQFYKVMMFGFTAINREYKLNELIRTDLNFCVLFDMV